MPHTKDRLDLTIKDSEGKIINFIDFGILKPFETKTMEVTIQNNGADISEFKILVGSFDVKVQSYPSYFQKDSPIKVVFEATNNTLSGRREEAMIEFEGLTLIGE